MAEEGDSRGRDVCMASTHKIDMSLSKLREMVKEGYDQPRQHIRKQRYYFANKGPSSQGYGFSSSHVWM